MASVPPGTSDNDKDKKRATEVDPFRDPRTKVSQVHPRAEVAAPDASEAVAVSTTFDQEPTPLDIPETSAIRGIKKLALQGGGMKGIGYVGAIQELERCGVLQQLQEVAGSSAGAIVATLIALGYTADDVKLAMAALDFRDLLDKDKTLADGLPFRLTGASIKSTASSAETGLAKATEGVPVAEQGAKIVGKAVGVVGTVVQGVAAAPSALETLLRVTLMKQTGLARGEAMLNLVAALIEAKPPHNPNLTFNDLATLAENNPGVYKKLVLTGSNLNPREGEDTLVYFQADPVGQRDPVPGASGLKLAGNMRIMDAVRISAGYPMAFQAVKITYPGDDHVDVMVDGGLKENLPDVFNKRWREQAKPGQEKLGNVDPECLALSFQAPETKPKVFGNLIDVLVDGILPALTDESPLKKQYQQKGKKGKMLVDIDTMGVGTLEFDASEKRKEALAASGGTSVRKAFEIMLAEERTQKLDKDYFSGLTDEALMRWKVFGSDESAVIRIINAVVREREKMIVSEQGKKQYRENLKAMEIRLKEKMEQGQVELPKGMTKEKLNASCEKGLQSLQKKLALIKRELQFLEDAKFGLEFREVEVMTKIKGSLFGGNDEFHKDLIEISNIQKEIAKNRENFEKLGESTSISAAELNADYEKMVSKKEELFIKIKEKDLYKRNEVLLDLVVDLQEKSKDYDFVVPTSLGEIESILRSDVHACEGYIKEAKGIVKGIEKEMSTLRKMKDEAYIAGYQELAAVKSNIDLAVKRTDRTLSSFFSKWIYKKPNWYQSILNVATKGIYHATTLPTRILSLVPLALYRFKHKMTGKQADLDTYRAWYNAAYPEDLMAVAKVRDLQGFTQRAIEWIRKSSEFNLKKGMAYSSVSSLFEDSGLKIGDIFSAKEGETQVQADKRIKELKKKMDAFKKNRSTYDAVDKVAYAKERETFLKSVLGMTPDEIKKFNESVRQTVNLSEPSQKALSQGKLSETDRKIMIEYVEGFDKKLNADTRSKWEPRPAEIARYIASLRALKKENSKEFAEKYEVAIKKFESEISSFHTEPVFNQQKVQPKIEPKNLFQETEIKDLKESKEGVEATQQQKEKLPAALEFLRQARKGHKPSSVDEVEHDTRRKPPTAPGHS